jgi:hypothetical protein
MTNTDDTRLLRTALRTNAVFTALCAAPLLLDGAALAPTFGLRSALPLYGLGAFFAVFAGVLWLAARRGRWHEALVLTVGDGAYALGSVLLVDLAPRALSAAGREATLLVALGVALCVAAQATGLYRSLRAARMA